MASVDEIIASSTKKNAASELALKSVMENAVSVAEDICEAYELITDKKGVRGEDVLNARNEGYAIAGAAAELHKRYLAWHNAQSAMVKSAIGRMPEGQYAELRSGGR